MTDRKLRFALIATRGGEEVVVCRASTREKLEEKREKMRAWSDAPLTIVEWNGTKRPERLKVGDQLQVILVKIREFEDSGRKSELLCDALELVAGRHRGLVDQILAAYQEAS